VLDWLVDGNPAVPDVLRPMTSARPDAMLPAGVVPGNVDRAFTGVYEFTGLQPDTVYWISLLADGPNSGYSKPERYRPPFLQTLISHSMCCWSLVSIRRRIAEDWQE
jgi:hypothetical protein